MSNLRRHIMMQKQGGENLYGFARMFPKSTYQSPEGRINALQYINDGGYVYALKFKDNDVSVSAKNSSGQTTNAYMLYVQNGEVVVRRADAVNGAVFSADVTDRILLLSEWYSYGLQIEGDVEYVAIKSNNVSCPTASYFAPSCFQIYVHETVTIGMRSNYLNAIPISADSGGEVDTCSLVFPSISSYSSNKPNFRGQLNLTSVIIRKAASTIPWVNTSWAGYGTPFYGCTNITKVTMEWDDADDIPQYKPSMFPTTATLYVPTGTTQLYTNKGWNALAQIIEY